MRIIIIPLIRSKSYTRISVKKLRFLLSFDSSHIYIYIYIYIYSEDSRYSKFVIIQFNDCVITNDSSVGIALGYRLDDRGSRI
jgi:hypothetical protein